MGRPWFTETAEFDSLPEPTRLQIVRLGDRSTTDSIREAVARGLRDENARVRLAAIGAVRRVDAPAVARLGVVLDVRELDGRGWW